MNTTNFTKNQHYLMLALDHRRSFKRLINPKNPDAVDKEQIIGLKKEIIAAVYDQLSGLLIDPEYGLKAYKNLNLTNPKPFLLSSEETGYKEENGEKLTEIKYHPQELKNFGAAGVKLLIYFNPYAKSAPTQIKTAKSVLLDAHKHGLLFFLEIIHYGMEPHVVQTVKIFLNNGIRPDVFKLEYPGSPKACQQTTDTLEDTPWILLTKGVNFEEFCPHLKIASKAGCEGFLAGRSLWQEALQTGDEQQKEKFLKEVLPSRFEKLIKISTNL